MTKPNFDPGFTQQYTGRLQRAIDTDGRFTVHRTGRTWRDAHPYLFLINASWPAFLATVGAAFVVINIAFAFIYLAIGIHHLKGADISTPELRFMNAFFFSTHTLTTVGYGNVWPDGWLANTASALEALFGLMGFAIATGLFFGRFSRPSARIGFSKSLLVAPFSGGNSLQFRIVNRRSNDLIELQAQLLLMTVEPVDGRLQRKFANLDLERTDILFFPLTWTIVHPITEGSPLYHLTAADLERLQAEVLVMIKGFDESFSQIVHVRYSYRYDEVIWGAKFKPAFEIEQNGEMRVEVSKVSDFESYSAPQLVN